MPAHGYETFRREARELFASQVSAAALEPYREAERELALESIDADCVADLARLEPHGSGNERPTFLARGVRSAGAMTALGARGLRGALRSGRGDLRCIAWEPGEGLARLADGGKPFDVHYRVSPPRRGFGLQLEIVAARPEASA